MAHAMSLRRMRKFEERESSLSLVELQRVYLVSMLLAARKVLRMVVRSISVL